MITVLGSFNMDLVIEAPRFPAPGEAVHGKNFRRACGGKGANQACAVARMGMKAAIIGAVGADAFGDEMLTSVRAAGVETASVVRRENVPSGAAMIVLDASGQNQIVVANGANDTLLAADIAPHAELIGRSRALVMQLETPLPGVTAAAEIAWRAGVPVIFNPAPYSPVPESLLQSCSFIIPNEGEAEHLTGIPIRGLASAESAAHRLRQIAPNANVLVTLGANGVWLDTDQFTGHVPGFAVTAVDTVGAGDTFIGAFAVRIVEGADAREAARFGCAAAAIAVTRRGAQTSIPSRIEVGRWLQEHP
jgi:ribokinase